MRRVLLIIGLLLLPVIPVVLVVTGVIKKKPTTVPAVTLTMWSTEDDEKAFTESIKSFRQTHSYVHITYRKVRSEDYATALVQAWAQGTGPDIFFVPHSWLGQMQPYAVGMPADLSISQIKVTKGWLGSRTDIIKPKASAPTLASIKDRFVDAVAGDIVSDGKVWGLPLAMDTIALYSNKDLLNNAKIFEPAKTWTELATHVYDNRLTVFDEHHNLAQSAVALGTVNNIPNGVDLLTLLMMQNGAVMTSVDKHTHFQGEAGLRALDFFTSFAQPGKKTYSWNADQATARDVFLQGKSAYYFGTYSDRAAIAASSLNWSVSPMLHLAEDGDKDGSAGNAARFIDTARYQVGMVSKASGRRSIHAWNFLNYLAQSSQATRYVAVTNKLSPLKKILATQKNQTDKSVFAGQLLTARTWYHGTDAVHAQSFLEAMVTSIIKNTATAADALKLAAQQVESTL